VRATSGLEGAAAASSAEARTRARCLGVADGTRTHDNQNHNRVPWSFADFRPLTANIRRTLDDRSASPRHRGVFASRTNKVRTGVRIVRTNCGQVNPHACGQIADAAMCIDVHRLARRGRIAVGFYPLG
jgi:hypothetical protein